MLSRCLLCLLGVLSLSLSGIASTLAQSRSGAAEPDVSIIRSGSCKIDTCLSYNFADFSFRVYAPQSPDTLLDIPQGACACAKLGKPSGFNNSLLFARKDNDGKVRPNISVVRGHAETTYEQFKRLENRLEPLRTFAWRDDQFRKFDVFQTAVEGAHGARRLFFLPKGNAEIEFKGYGQRVAFVTPLPLPPDYPSAVERGPNVAATVRLSDNSYFSQFLEPANTPSDDWVTEIQATGRFIFGRVTFN